MGRALLVGRLVLRDLRRHPVEAVVFLLAITATTTALSIGLALGGATDTLYQATRAQTFGPDVVAVSSDASPEDLAGVTWLEQAPGVVGHGGPYPVLEMLATAHGRTVDVMVLGRSATPALIDRPLVTTGSWVRTGGAVVERGFAEAVDVRVGDRITVAGRAFPVVGIAVTAANAVYPGGLMTGGGLVDHHAGVVWLTERDAGALSSPEASAYYLLDLKLADPAATKQFLDSLRTPAIPTIPVHTFSWQDFAAADSGLLRGTEPALVIGGWLLAVLAISCLAGLVAARAAQQTRRVGLLKAVGAGPGLVAMVVLAEYLALALTADGLGLVIGWLTAPTLTDPSAGLLSSAIPPSGGTIAAVTLLALTVAVLTTLGPAVRAASTSTVHALADAARTPQYRDGSAPMSARLPTPLLLGVLLTARRPRRAVLTAVGTTTTSVMITVLLIVHAQPSKGYNLGPSTLSNLRDDQLNRVLLVVTIALIALAAVNVMVTTWSTAREARHSLAIARTLGATPGQVTGGLCVAQLLPALPGALVGIPIGIALVWPFSVGTMTMPAAWWLLAAPLATLLAVAALTAAPAGIEACRPVADVLRTETAQ